MTAFGLFGGGAKMMSAGLYFTSCVLLLISLLYSLTIQNKTKNIINIIILCAEIITTAFISVDSASVSHIPFPIVMSVPVLLCLYSLISIFRTYINKRQRLTRASVKEAIDNINMGIAFSDDLGRIVLVNKTMSELAMAHNGRYPQLYSELTALIGNDGYLCTPGDKVWRINDTQVMAPEFTSYRQLTAFDITALTQGNAQLNEENEKLAETNRKISEMLNTLSDRIREQETLELRRQIHNDIGTSLISLSRLAEHGSGEDVEAELRSLKEAVSFFSNNRVHASSSLEKVIENAEMAGIKIVIDGDAEKVSAVLCDALNECVTNCIKHARGNRIDVKITDRSICITNNGKAPDKPVKEGGGLTSLRRKAEGFGYEMSIEHSPVFRLILTVSKE